MMLRAFPSWSTAILLNLALLVGCGDDSTTPQGGGGDTPGGAGGVGGEGASGGGGSDPYTGPCTVLSLGDTMVFYESITRGAIVPVQPDLPDLAKTRLTMELYEDDGSGRLPPLTPGTFSFAQAPDDNYGTCQHCALLVGYAKSGQPLRAFYPKSGSVTLNNFDAEDWSIFSANLQNVELFEVRQNEDLSWEFKGDDACFYVAQWDVDTRPVDGEPCSSAEQCGNEVQQVCSPASDACVPQECDLLFDGPFCDGTDVCLSQLWDPDALANGPALGACYARCASDGECASDEVCRVLGPTQSLGVCMQRGTLPLGASCTPRDNSTECEAGAFCWGEPGECQKTCTYLNENEDCPNDRFCSIANICKPASFGDPAKIGESCEANSPETTECGIEGSAYRGICLRIFPEQPEALCERLCRTDDPVCGVDEACIELFSNPELGLCKPAAVCGDGVLNVIAGELCDDGNLNGNDACNADCSSANFGFLCGQTQTLSLDTPIEGTTIGGPSGYGSTCDPYVATTVANYSFLPPGPGRLTVKLSSTADLSLNLMSDCALADSQLACSGLLGDDELTFDVVATVQEPLLLQVRGQTPAEAGPFTLFATFEPAVCGDGKTGGPEACDDGNTASNDGCSADCLAIEWDLVCEALPELPLTTTLGTTVGSPALFDLSGLCSFASSDARAYRFVAPSDGTLQLLLAEPNVNLVFYVQDGCGPITGNDFLACGNSSPANGSEYGEALLSAGQNVTVIVAGFASAGGVYALTSTFTPTP